MDIRSYLKQGRPLLFDGAMGTYFASLPGRAEERCEHACLDHPEEVRAIHRAYLEAGCRAVKANTFSVGADLAQGDEELAKDIIGAACRLASEEVSAFNAYVFADLGPAPEDSILSPADNYCRQADWFLDQGIRHFLVETLPSDDGIPELARHLKTRCPEAYLIVSFAVAPGGVTRYGVSGAELYRRTAALPEVDAVGFNCVSGPHHLMEYIQTLAPVEKPLSVMPNAGYPTVLGRRTVYHGAPEYFGQKLAQIAQAGASIVGGCCGTTPAHIAQAARALESAPAQAAPSVTAETRERRTPGTNTLAEKLNSGRRVIAVELDPPVDDNITPFLDGVRVLRDAGADAITIADCPIGRPRQTAACWPAKFTGSWVWSPCPT